MKYLWFLFVLNITITWDLDKTGVTKGYKIYYTQGGRQYMGTSKTNRFTIEETVPRRPYKVYVTATNQCCESGKSRIITVINP